MRHRSMLLAALALLTLSGVAAASPRGELKGADAESALRRTRRDATWLRQASVRPATTPYIVRAGGADLGADLDAWLRRDRGRPAEATTVRTATATPPR